MAAVPWSRSARVGVRAVPVVRARRRSVRAAAAGDRSQQVQSIARRRGDVVASPIVTSNLWFDRPVLDEPFVGLPGRAMQWVFDKRRVFGDGASHLSLVSSGADRLVRHAERRAHRGWRMPSCSRRCRRVRPARLLRATVVRERARRFRSRPGSRRGRRPTPPCAACFSPATGSTPACPLRSKARSAAATAPRTRCSSDG